MSEKHYDFVGKSYLIPFGVSVFGFGVTNPGHNEWLKPGTTFLVLSDSQTTGEYFTVLHLGLRYDISYSRLMDCREL